MLAANDRAAELLGVPRRDLLGGVRPDGWDLRDDFGAPLPAITDLAAQVLTADAPATGPFVITLRGVPYRRLWAEVYPVLLRGERLMVAVLHPVQTDLWRTKGLLDPLTGLPNRTLLLDRLEQALTRARTLGTMASVILADLRGLGERGRAKGFRHGDRVLAAVGRRLRAELRADHTVARYGGGTFAVVADHPHGTGEPIADRTRVIAGRAMRTGWATSDGGDTVHELVGLAESRLRKR